jgi:hypothetical protein
MMDESPAVAPDGELGRARRLHVAGWLALIAAAVSWCLIIATFSVMWEDSRLLVVPQGEVWDSGPYSFEIDHAGWSELLAGVNDRDISPTPGAVFVLVVLRFVVGEEADNYGCSMKLMGKGRSWNASLGVLPPGELVPGAVSFCSSTDAEGQPTSSGLIADLYEIPADAVQEIQGVRVAVFASGDSFDINITMREGLTLAILGFDLT